MEQKEESEAATLSGQAKFPYAVTQGFLQTVVDALPEGLVVIDRDRNVVMANRVANVRKTCLKCFECLHREREPCADVSCPWLQVLETKAPVRVYHSHYTADDREISVAIDAAPILDEAGEVAFVIETCRDVTERTLARRLSRIGNRHMTMQPLLAEYASELRDYTRCADVRIHIAG